MALNGSKKYPSSQLYNNLQYQTYNSYMNGYTYNRYSTYPVSSLSEAQLLKLADFFTDSCFHPMVLEDESIFTTEAWRYRLNDPDDPLTIEGTVYSEMLGKRSVERSSYLNALGVMFPGTTLGNEHGGDPDHIPELTWEAVKDYHKKYYHPSNCTAYLYGQFEDYVAFLELLDSCFAEYDKEEFSHIESGYEPLSEPVVASFSFPVEKGSNTRHASIIYYGFLCPDLKQDREQELILNTLTDLLNDEASLLQQSFKEALPYGDLRCCMELYGPDDVITFVARNVDPEDAELFSEIVNNGIAAVAENGFPSDQVDSVKASMSLEALQAREACNPVEKVILPMVEYDATSLAPWNYEDFEDSLNQMDKWNEQGLYAKAVSRWLTDNLSTALVTTWPEAGKREILDAELDEKLSAVKAGMSDEEIAEIVAYSNADYEYEDTSEMVESLQAVKVESLPEETRLYDVHDKTAEDGVRHIDVVANAEGIGTIKLLLDTSGFEQEDIHWLNLYTGLLSSLETDTHSTGELATLVRRYLHNASISPTSYQEGKDGYHPWLEITWTSLDGDLEKSYDLIGELLFTTRFDDPDKILETTETIEAAYRYSIPDYIEEIMKERAFGRDSKRMRYDSYLDGLDYYDFLIRTQKQLQEDPDTVMMKLKGVRDALNNRRNAVAIFAGNENSIALNRPLADRFFALLDSHDIRRVEYDLPLPEKSEALIIDSSIQYNQQNVTYRAMGYEDYEGWMTVAAHIVTDFYLTPLLRDRYGVYDPYCANQNTSDGGLYIYTYEDPNIAETFDLIKKLPQMLKEEEIDQQTIDNYILSSYAYFAKPKGILAGAIDAADEALMGLPQNETLTWMRQIKECTPEKLKEWAQMLQILADKGTLFTAGSASAIKAEEGRYDRILDTFGTGDR